MIDTGADGGTIPLLPDDFFFHNLAKTNPPAAAIAANRYFNRPAMKKYFPFFTLIFFISFTACSPLKGFNVKPIFELYGGTVGMGKEYSASTSSGSKSSILVTIENNKPLEARYLTPEALANNCAILFVKTNPQTFEKADQLNIEIISGRSYLFNFSKEEMDHKMQAAAKIEVLLNEFVNKLEAGNWKAAAEHVKFDPLVDDSAVTISLKNIRSLIPPQHSDIRLLGFVADNAQIESFNVDLVIFSKDGTQKWMNVTFFESSQGLVIRNISV